MCELICDVIRCYVLSFNADEINVYEFFKHKSLSNRWFRHGIYSLLRRADARGSAT